MMNQQQPSDAMPHAVSALVDGELSGAELAQVCNTWRDDPMTRRQWHAYQLIGDVMRSDDLASTAARDAAFLGALRVRLAEEPVPLAPQPLSAVASPPSPRTPRWMAPAAAAAGFCAVAVVLVMMRTPAPGSVPVLAQAGAAPVAGAAAAPADLELVRQAGLERYLSAHRKVSNGMGLAMPVGAVRHADVVVLDAK